MLTKLFVRTQNALVKDEGATMVEYGLLVALIAVVLIGALIAVQEGLTGMFNDVAGNL